MRKLSNLSKFIENWITTLKTLAVLAHVRQNLRFYRWCGFFNSLSLSYDAILGWAVYMTYPGNVWRLKAGRMNEAGFRKVGINTDYFGRFVGRRWGRTVCRTSDECTKRIDGWMKATTASPTAVQVEWRHFHTNLALKYWAVKKTVTRDTT